LDENTHDDPLSVSRLPQEEELRFSAPALQIKGYQILEKLGEAGQGQVWRAVQSSTESEVIDQRSVARRSRETVPATASLGIDYDLLSPKDPDVTLTMTAAAPKIMSPK
jgi:hypothetical protein